MCAVQIWVWLQCPVEMLEHPPGSSVLCVLGHCGDCGASVGSFQGLCPKRAVPTYAKRVDVTVPVLNEEGDVIEDHDCESKPQVCWKVFAFQGSCISAFGQEGGHILEDVTVNLELLCSSGLYHREQLLRTRACSAPSVTSRSLHP